MKKSEVIEKVDEVIKRRHLSPKTKAAYLPRILQFIDFCRSNSWLSSEEKINVFLSRMATERNVAAGASPQP